MRHIILILAVFISSLCAYPQRTPGFPREDRVENPEEARLRHDREKAMNTKRQEDLKRDTDRLLKLATELKENVDKTSENVLSLDVIKKAEEIEKLAKSVREKMRAQGLQPIPAMEPPR